MSCTQIVFCFCFDIQNNLCIQHVLSLQFSCTELLSYCGLVDARISASEKDLPVPINQKSFKKKNSHLSLSIRCFESIFVIGLSHTDNIDFWHCIFGGIFPRIVFIWIVFACCSDNYRVHRRNGFAKPCMQFDDFLMFGPTNMRCIGIRSGACHITKFASQSISVKNEINGILIPKLFCILWEKNVLVIEKKFWNSRLKAENF